jgi:AraC family transcriptional regulator
VVVLIFEYSESVDAMIAARHAPVLGKIAPSGTIAARILAGGEGWYVEDVLCTSGPRDRPFEEQHPDVSISVVASGTFQYRSAAGEHLLTPGSLLLGNAGECYECGHEHGSGDRCVAFHYTAEMFEELARDAGATPRTARFRVARMPPLRELAPLVARCWSGLEGASALAWEELGLVLGARALQLAAGLTPPGRSPPRHVVARVTDAVRRIERHPGARHALAELAREAQLSPYHFLRTFERLTGVTPHQFLLRARLREAARRLTTSRRRVIDVALDAGFSDVSNFNRAFRAEFGVAPMTYRASGMGIGD